MSTICIACLIYTLEDKSVEDNMYINIFYIWLSKLIQSGGLTSNDCIHIHIDQRTMTYLENSNTVLPCIFECLPCPYVIHLIPSPKTSLEGMMNKYNITEYTHDIYIYCDIDILIINPLSTMTKDMVPNKIYACTEGRLQDIKYSDGFSTESAITPTMPGFSAGKFAITGKPLRDDFFKMIHQLCDYSTKYYTVEQPYFNRALYSVNSVDIDLLTSFVSFNGDEYDRSKTIFHDLAGNPGNDIDHMKRVMDNICLYLCGFYTVKHLTYV